MNMGDLISHYKKVKTLYSPLSTSLEEKLTHIERVFSDMPASANSQEIAARAKEAWPKASPGTVRRYLVQLKAIVRRAELDSIILRAQHIDMPYVNDTIYVDISYHEVTILLDHIQWTEPQWYPLALLLTNTGARLSEVLRLDLYSDFTKHGTVLLKPVGVGKVKTIERVIPYTNRLREEIEDGLFKRAQIVPPGIAEDSVPACFGRVLSAATEALGITRLRVHDLRHAFASILAEHGADLADLASAMGHSNISMSMRYRGLIKTKLTGIMAQM
jgi:integrase